MKRERRTYKCPYNNACACQRRRCSSRGWNPEVEKRRYEELREKYGWEVRVYGEKRAYPETAGA